MQLDEWQKRFLHTKGDKILCTGRQVGKTFICAQDASSWAVKNSNKTILMIAPTERQARILFDATLKYLLNYHRSKVINKGVKRPTKQRIHLRNKTRILCLPTGISGITIRGYTVHRLYADEAARIPEEVWTAVQPMLLTTGGSTIMLSTPHGAQGEFHRCWINKDGAYDSFTRFDPENPITSEVIMRERQISISWTELQREKALQKIEQARARMTNLEFAQEYLGQFVDDFFKFFPDNLLAECCTLKRPEFIQKSRQHFLGVDIARLGDDKSTFEIVKRLDTGKLEHVESIITKKKRLTETERKILELDRLYRFKKIYIDAGSGSLGVSVFDHLFENPQTKRKVVAINNRKMIYDRDGHTQRMMKEDLYNNLKRLMEQGKIKILNDDEVIESLQSVQYENVTEKGKATYIRIFSVPHNLSDVAEGLIRAAYAAKEKHLNLHISYI